MTRPPRDREGLPRPVETTFVEKVPENDSDRPIEQLARSGHKLIFTTSFGFMSRPCAWRGASRT